MQNAIYRVLGGFVSQGRPSKLLLLHGPNGSAKSTCVAALARALEHYCRLDEGAMYRFNWIFPAGTHTKGGIGFTGAQSGSRLDSFAHLPESMVDARLPDELRDHPLLLIPKQRRAGILGDLLSAKNEGHPLPDSLRYGELSHRNREIFESLLALYQGRVGEPLDETVLLTSETSKTWAAMLAWSKTSLPWASRRSAISVGSTVYSTTRTLPADSTNTPTRSVASRLGTTLLPT